MPKRIIKALAGGLTPWKPKRSLPSYKEPTPETNPKLSREDEAELALKHTEFAPGTALFLITLFLGAIVSVPLIQLGVELSRADRGARLPMLEVLKALPSKAEVGAVRNPRDLWDLLPRADELKEAEKTLEGDSVVSRWLLPPVQSILVGRLRAGNEQVYPGRGGWLFYRPDVDYVTGPPFLSAAQLKRRGQTARAQPDPLRAIVQFRDQLAARGIDLVVVPVPTKASIEADKLSANARNESALQNGSFAGFQGRLVNAGVRVFDPAPLLMERKAVGPVYLQTDTHWRPEAMELTAQALAASLNLPRASAEEPVVAEREITQLGDVARMLLLPASQQSYRPEKVMVRQVTVGNGLWRPTRDAEVLLLGDSFANIFSLEALGWGESAGLAEHLSVALGGRRLDCILRNSDGAFATREMLMNELARGRDRLSGKKLVIWEFAARELAFGNWKLLDMQLGQTGGAEFFSPKPGEQFEIAGTVDAVSFVPRPGTAPYQDHVMAVQLGDVDIPSRPQGKSEQALVYLFSMRDNVWTSAARLRPGDRVTVRVRAWPEVAPQYEQINRSEIDDPAVQLEEPVWGELVK